MALLAACTPEAAPSPTPIVLVKLLATAYISPSPNPEQRAATQAAITPTPIPPSATPSPAPTAYMGVFIGRAEQDPGFIAATTPLFADLSITAEPTASYICTIQVDDTYYELWLRQPRLYQALRCPIQRAYGFFGTTQFFERGIIYYDPATRTVWAIAPEAGRAWVQEAPPPQSLEAIQAPLNLLLPTGDIGALWSNPDVQQALGFARTDEQAVDLALQRFEGGSFLQDSSSGQFYAVQADGTLFGPFALPPPVAQAAETLSAP